MKLFSESFWGDVHKRSRGQTIRMEDDVQSMSVDTFFAHLVEKYKDKLYWMDKDHYVKEYDEDIVVDVRRGISIYGNYKNDELQRILVVLVSSESSLSRTKYVQHRLESDKFETTDIPGREDRFCVTYKHGVLNNHTYVDLIEFLLNIHINESFWGDVHKRSRGDEIRKEDDINNLDAEEFVQYLKDNYEVCISGPNFFQINYWVNSGTYKGNISIPIEQNDYGDTPNLNDRKLTIRINLETNEYLSIEPNKYFFRLYPRELKKTFGDKYEVDTKFGQDGQLIPKDGKITNQVCVDVIDKLLGMVERPILTKKVTESFWGDVHKRSRGDEVRAEDSIDIYDPDDFVAYVRKIYKFDNTPYDIENRTNSSTIFIPICTTGIKNIKLVAIYFDYNEEVVYTHNSVKKYIPKLWAKLDQDFDLWDDDPDYRNHTIINPKDTSRKVNNSYVLEVLNFICDNLDDTVTPCLFRRTNESFWGNVHRRSRGDEARKEDDFSDVLVKLEEYIQDYAADVVNEFGRTAGDCTLNAFVDYLINYKDASERVIQYTKDNWDEKVFDSGQTNFEQYISYSIEEEERGGGVRESFWGDVHKRSRGDSMRKEDEVLSEDELNQIDQYITDYGNEVVLGWGRGSDACNLDEFINYLKTDRKVTDRILKYVKDNWFGEICDDVEGSIEQAQLEYNQDMYESFWGDVHKRSRGDSMRKEDEVLSDMEINSLNQFTLMYCRKERAHYIQNNIIPPPPSGRKENDYEGLIKYIEDRRDENKFINVGDYNKIIRFIKKNWDKLDMDKYIKKYIFSPDMMKDKKIVECEGVPGGLTPADVGGMGAAYFPGPNGEPGSGDLPSPTGIVYKQVAPFDTFIKMRRPKKNKKKKFRKEDEPCVHSPNAKVYDYVDDFRDYVDRTYNNIDRRK